MIQEATAIFPPSTPQPDTFPCLLGTPRPDPTAHPVGTQLPGRRRMLLGDAGDKQPLKLHKCHWRGKDVGSAPGVRLGVTSATIAWAGVCRNSHPN